VNGKNDTVPKPIVIAAAVSARNHQTRLFHENRSEFLAGQIAEKVIPPLGRVSQLELLHDLARDPASRQVVEGRPSRGLLQQRLSEIVCGQSVHLEKRCLFAALTLSTGR
jgi:hypothetical protein